MQWERDGQAVCRLFQLYDEEARLTRAVRRRRWVPGSTGQPTLSPLHGERRAVRAEIRQLEDRFGLNPKAAAGLGISLGGLKKTMDELNREANERDDDEDTDDPRLSVAR